MAEGSEKGENAVIEALSGIREELQSQNRVTAILVSVSRIEVAVARIDERTKNNGARIDENRASATRAHERITKVDEKASTTSGRSVMIAGIVSALVASGMIVVMSFVLSKM